MRLVAALMAEEDGATAIEYGLIASLIALAIVGAALSVSAELDAMWTTLATHV